MAADLLGDGNVKVSFVLTVANIAAPTATELNGGTDLQEYITKEGLEISAEQTPVDNTALASVAETEDAGTTKYEITLTYKRKALTADDVAFTTLVPGTLGYLCVRRNKAHTTAWAASDEVEVYPVRVGSYMRQPPALNEPQTVQQRLFNHEAPDTEASVAA
ncbi:hypothetical protein BJF79_13840 [Actinomadura sp. CNU-125]|uniref:phage tail tube protein n=1 Tax=Actinomadura sp. CNU-125 TaxID=1904961 RepID=UPI00095BCA37|nr:hypothetical protein [Actinomadura sp. CNU-125]OLT24419.1 hypothetical protein BJF79_13840 [Actinomadura sp. CNU-125]